MPASALPIDWTVRIDAGVLAFTFVAAALAAILSGLAPALHAARWDCMSVLRGGSVFPGGKVGRARKSLVVCQLALSLTLLIGAALAVRGLVNVMSLDLGFDPSDVLVTSLDLELQGYGPQEAVQIQRELKERVGALPGVEGVALAQRVPLDLRVSRLGVVPEGFDLPRGSPRPVVDYNVIDADYFDLLRIRLLRGRGFTEADDKDAPAVMVINETFAERFWPGQDPLGKRVLTLGGEHTVVGIVGDGKYQTIGEDPLPYVYLSLRQSHRGAVVLHLRSPAGSSSLAAAVRAEILALDETLPVDDLQAMRSAMGFALLPARLAAGMVTGLATVSLLLASIGLFGVISSAVSQGMHDIGVRVALGASPADVVTFVLRQGVLLTATGIVFGLIGGFALARVMAALLFEVSATDMFAYVPAAALLTGVALLASFGPARRAARADTLAALKAE
jgi:predicted permease